MRSLVVALSALTAFLGAPSANARSAFELTPPVLEPIPAGTYDDHGRRVGDATLFYERQPDGRIHMGAITAMTDGPNNIIDAEFEDIDGGRAVRVVRESSLSHDVNGNPMTLVEIDHEKREARCTPPGATREQAEVIELPENDHVGNTIMGLLFQPLVRGEVDRLEFQAFVCRGGARLVDFVALPAKSTVGPSGHRIVEIRFGPDLGRVISWFASVLVPKLRFWFDAQGGEYLAHRMPLYGGGPEVVVAREGVSAGFDQR